MAGTDMDRNLSKTMKPRHLDRSRKARLKSYVISTGAKRSGETPVLAFDCFLSVVRHRSKLALYKETGKNKMQGSLHCGPAGLRSR